MLIQIADPAYGFPVPAYNFSSVHQFEFLDCEKDSGFPEESKFTYLQAKMIKSLLEFALTEEMNVIVHCHAGICRSGAIVEVATMMGFEVAGKRNRIPNLMVKTMLMDVLGLTYNEVK
jgi:protein tyrosine phosphatase